MIQRVYALCGFILFLFFQQPALAQESSESLDPVGYVNKYDSSFSGIGPRVYLLPAPRTAQEILLDSYEQKQHDDFFDSISFKLDSQRLLKAFRPASNLAYLERTFSPFPGSDSAWHVLLLNLEDSRQWALLAGLSNQYAIEKIKADSIAPAANLLGRGLQAAKQGHLDQLTGILEQNLATLHLLSGNIDEAAKLQAAFLDHGGKKGSNQQASSLVDLALLKAYNKSYQQAEDLIIKKAIPIFNRNKNLEGKARALIYLAKVYQLQNKHTQAQWFLIQAQDIAMAKKIEEALPEIEYMLAFSKFVQQNYRVAQSEFEQAKRLAKAQNNKLLQLAISDKLGDIYLHFEDYGSAKQELEDYQRLRAELFPFSDVL